MLERCRKKGLKLNADKLQFPKTGVPLVGHVLSDKGRQMQQEKGAAIINMARPDDISAVRRLLGMANYVARFIQNLATVAATLR